MKYGDFSSLVQLGVGLHIGTALFQLYGEIGVQPLERRLARLRTLATGKAAQVADDLEDIETEVDVFKIDLFKAYRRYVRWNSIVAVLLTIVLIAISFAADVEIPTAAGIFLSALCVGPAGATLFALWLDASRRLAPIERKAEELESRALQLHGRGS